MTIRAFLGETVSIWEARRIAANFLQIDEAHAHMLLYLDYEAGELDAFMDEDDMFIHEDVLKAWLMRKVVA